LAVYIAREIKLDTGYILSKNGWNSFKDLDIKSSDYTNSLSLDQVSEYLNYIPNDILVFTPIASNVYIRLLKILEESLFDCYLIVEDLMKIPSTIRSRSIIMPGFIPSIKKMIDWVKKNDFKYPGVPIGEMIFKGFSKLTSGMSVEQVWDSLILSSAIYAGQDRDIMRKYIDSVSALVPRMNVRDVYELYSMYIYFGESLFDKSMGELL
jgi:hypothetical protein